MGRSGCAERPSIPWPASSSIVAQRASMPDSADEEESMRLTKRSMIPAALIALAAAGACTTKGGRTTYANDGDTGAAAPATKIDMSATPNAGDSTSSPALPQATGRAGSAGDTIRGREKVTTPAYPRDTTRRKR
jgi:hypothetical protein